MMRAFTCHYRAGPNNGKDSEESKLCRDMQHEIFSDHLGLHMPLKHTLKCLLHTAHTAHTAHLGSLWAHSPHGTHSPPGFTLGTQPTRHTQPTWVHSGHTAHTAHTAHLGSLWAHSPHGTHSPPGFTLGTQPTWHTQPTWGYSGHTAHTAHTAHLGLLWPPSPVWTQGRGSRTPVSAGVGVTQQSQLRLKCTRHDHGGDPAIQYTTGEETALIFRDLHLSSIGCTAVFMNRATANQKRYNHS